MSASLSAARLKTLVAEYSAGADWTLFPGPTAPHTIDDDAVKLSTSRIREFVRKQQDASAEPWALVPIIYSAGAILLNRKFAEVFRPTLYPDRALQSLEALFTKAIAVLANRNLPKAIQTRTAHLRNYAALYAATRQQEASLIQAIHSSDGLALHSMLTRVEQAFADRTPRVTEPYARALGMMSAEDIAGGASYAIEAFDRWEHPYKTFFRRFDSAHPVLRPYDDGLLAASRLRDLLDAEASVFRLEYQCLAEGTTFTIAPPTQEMGMALSLGYTRHDLAAASHRDPGTTATSFFVACNRAAEKLGDVAFHTVGTGSARRIAFLLPEPAMKRVAELLLLPDQFFAEELAILSSVCDELLVPLETLLTFKVADTLSLGDVIRIQRFFTFMALVRRTVIDSGKYDTVAARNSVLGGSQADDLERNLQLIGFPKDAVSAFFRMFSWRSGGGSFLDVQYWPLLVFQSGDTVIPFFTIATSNLIRAALIISERRIHSDGTSDPVAAELDAAFHRAGISCRTAVDYQLGGVKGDLDAVARIGSCLYVFECKHTLLPCSAFEQRTTWDYLEEASDQLDRLREHWNNTAFREHIGQRVGWDCSDLELVTCIVFSHRLLSGVAFKGHPIRTVRELSNVIIGGDATITIGEAEVRLPTRKDYADVGGALNDYLSDSWRLNLAVFQSFYEDSPEWTMGAARVRWRRYAFSPLKHIANLGLVGPDLVKRLHEAADNEFTAQSGLDGSQPALERFEQQRRVTEQLLRDVETALAATRPGSTKSPES